MLLNVYILIVVVVVRRRRRKRQSLLQQTRRLRRERLVNVDRRNVGRFSSKQRSNKLGVEVESLGRPKMRVFSMYRPLGDEGIIVRKRIKFLVLSLDQYHQLSQPILKVVDRVTLTMRLSSQRAEIFQR